MFVYFDNQGTLKEIVNDSAIRQGNYGVNKIYFFIEGAVDDNGKPLIIDGVYKALDFDAGRRTFTDVSGNTLTTESFSLTTVTKEIPFNKKRELKWFKYWTNYEFFVINLPSEVLVNHGTVGCSIDMIENDTMEVELTEEDILTAHPAVTLGWLIFNVEQTATGAIIEPDTAINIAQWNYLIHNMVTMDDLDEIGLTVPTFDAQFEDPTRPEFEDFQLTQEDLNDIWTNKYPLINIKVTIEGEEQTTQYVICFKLTHSVTEEAMVYAVTTMEFGNDAGHQYDLDCMSFVIALDEETNLPTIVAVNEEYYTNRFDRLENIPPLPTNLENGDGTNAVRQKMADTTVDFTGRNPNAEALDPTLSANINTGAGGNQSSAFGKNTMALSTASFASGNKTVAKGEESHAEGYQSVTLGDGSHAEGAQTVSAGLQSHSEGALTQALGDESHAEGHGTIAGALASHSEGAGTKVGNYSQESGIGADHTVSPTPGPSPTPTPPSYVAQPGEGSHVEGYDNIVSGYGSHAEGVRNYVTGNYSHAEGINNSLLKNYAHVSGYNNISNADCSETSGIWNTNNGYGSFVTGYYNECSYNHQAIFGKYNLNKSDTLFEVGNGTADNARSNAFEVHGDGRATIGAAPTNDMDAVNKKYFEDNLKTINGQPIHGTGNIQISVNQSGLWVHDMLVISSISGYSYHLQIIDADSTPFTQNGINDNRFRSLIGHSLKVLSDEGGGNMALVTYAVYTAGTGSFTLVLTVAGATYHALTLSDIDTIADDSVTQYN